MSSKRYARLQVDADSIPDDDKPPQTGHTFNIWFLKWAGGDSSNRNTIKSKFRVNIKRDSGATRGVEHKSPICLFFARGCCYRGRKCPYLHRLPKMEDSKIPTQDCFGRDKTADYRDDMGGVGSLQKHNRTLFIGGAHMNDSTQEMLNTQFSEFGSIDKIRVLHAKNCAFISYRLEAEAQFAKEAMDCQTVDGNDVISVKWANEDPDPNAQASAKREMEALAMETVRNLLGGNAESDGSAQKPSRKRRRDTPEERSETAKKDAGVDGPAKDDFSMGVLESGEVSEPVGILDLSRINALKKLRGTLEVSTAVSASKVDQSNVKNVENSSGAIIKDSRDTATPNGLSLLTGYSSDSE